jgi:H+/Cl- antiporter ClcA
MPALRTLASAVLSVIIVGLGVSLGREGAPKQTGAVFANLFSDKGRLSDEQRRLLVACGAGAGMGAAYGVPLGGALLHWKSCAESWRSVLSFPPFLRR